MKKWLLKNLFLGGRRLLRYARNDIKTRFPSLRGAERRSNLDFFNNPRKTVILFLVGLSNLIFFCGAVCFAEQISSTELINDAKEYDGKSVVYAGEAVGDVMVRGDFAWVNVNDGENAVGVWLNKELAGEIRFTGSYRAKGDMLEITGVFQRNCIQHGGDMDIHAQGIRKISPGRVVSEELDTSKRNFVFILLVVLCLVFVFVRRQKSV